MEPVIRISRPGDEAALRALRGRCLPEGGLLSEKAYQPGGAVVAETDGSVVSLAPLLYPGDAVFGDGKAVPCASVGLSCTLPAWRGKGLASKELSAAVFQGFGMGAPVAVTRPAEEAQFSFCAGSGGFSDFFYAAKAELDREQIGRKPAETSDVHGEAYGALRERLLAGRFHIRLSASFLRSLEEACVRSGGGLLAFSAGGESGCAAVRLSGDTAELLELLTGPEETEPALAAAKARFPAGRYTALTPAGRDRCFGTLVRYAMAVGDGSVYLARDIAALPWYGPLME